VIALNEHRRKMWIDADNWMYAIEQSRQWTLRDRQQHVKLSKVKANINAIEESISKESCKGNKDLYIYRQPTNETERCRPMFNKL